MFALTAFNSFGEDKTDGTSADCPKSEEDVWSTFIDDFGRREMSAIRILFGLRDLSIADLTMTLEEEEGEEKDEEEEEEEEEEEWEELNVGERERGMSSVIVMGIARFKECGDLRPSKCDPPIRVFTFLSSDGESNKLADDQGVTCGVDWLSVVDLAAKDESHTGGSEGDEGERGGGEEEETAEEEKEGSGEEVRWGVVTREGDNAEDRGVRVGVDVTESELEMFWFKGEGEEGEVTTLTLNSGRPTGCPVDPQGFMSPSTRISSNSSVPSKTKPTPECDDGETMRGGDGFWRREEIDERYSSLRSSGFECDSLMDISNGFW